MRGCFTAFTRAGPIPWCDAFLADCMHQRLVPRDPRFVISEIESM